MEVATAIEEDRHRGRKRLRGVSPQGTRLGDAFDIDDATFIRHSFYGPGQRGGAEWPRAEILGFYN